MTSRVPPRPIEDRVVLRVPPWQASVVFVAAAVCAFVAIYTHVNTGARIFFALLAVATAVSATMVARAYLVADADGIYLRTFAAHFIPWEDVASVEVVVRKNQPRLFVFRDGRKTVSVPSFLLLPLTPAGFAKTQERLGGLANRITTQRPRR